MNNEANQHQHTAVIESLKDKLQRLGSRKDDAGRFARAQFKTRIKLAQDRLAAFQKAEAAYSEVYQAHVNARTAYDRKRAELLAAVETELAPFAQRFDDAARADTHPPRLDPFPWSYSGSSTGDLVQKALHDPAGNHGANLGEFIAHRRTLPAGDMALAILEEGQHTPSAPVREAFEIRWSVWSAANREVIAALGV